MKFKDDYSAKLFAIEAEEYSMVEVVNRNWNPEKRLIEFVIQKRRSMQSFLKDKRKASAQKSNWRANRYEIMKGIKAFHKSTEGKRFHRNLGRFLANREFSPIKGSSLIKTGTFSMSHNERLETMKGLSSARTHMIIESSYYHGMSEQVGVDWLTEVGIQIISNIERKIFMGETLYWDDLCPIFDVTETAELVKSFADRFDTSVEKVESIWNSIKKSLKDQGKSEDDESFYPILVSALKKALKKQS